MYENPHKREVGRQPLVIEGEGRNDDTKVLFIDDSRVVLHSLSERFKEVGLSYFCTEGWLAYLDEVKKEKKSKKKLICITDLNMPAMSGDNILKFLYLISPEALMILFSDDIDAAKSRQERMNNDADKNIHYYPKEKIDDMMSFIRLMTSAVQSPDEIRPS